MSNSAVKIDKDIAMFLGRTIGERQGNDQFQSSILDKALRSLMEKDEQCLSCPSHHKMLADLEIGRQKMASARVKSGAPKGGVCWIRIRKSIQAKAIAFAEGYRRPLKHMAEQAILEFLMWPRGCHNCPTEKKWQASFKKIRLDLHLEEGLDKMVMGG